jgi:hypothetical protein
VGVYHHFSLEQCVDDELLKTVPDLILQPISDMAYVPIAGLRVRSMVPLIIFCFTSSSGAAPEYAVIAI